MVSGCLLIKLSGTEGGKSPGGALPSPVTGSAISLDTDGPDLLLLSLCSPSCALTTVHRTLGFVLASSARTWVALNFPRHGASSWDEGLVHGTVFLLLLLKSPWALGVSGHITDLTLPRGPSSVANGTLL